MVVVGDALPWGAVLVQGSANAEPIIGTERSRTDQISDALRPEFLVCFICLGIAIPCVFKMSDGHNSILDTDLYKVVICPDLPFVAFSKGLTAWDRIRSSQCNKLCLSTSLML